MPIQSLSDSDIRALGSSLVLNDARSVIKELIDNALDAHADTIFIEISANTIDVIQVRDNGSGIGVEDRNLLCKRGCTSKIRTIQDLENLGGSSLGFRGEALASVAGLSNCVVVTTRIDGELVGSASTFDRKGERLSFSPASHPVGTTIRVQDFLKTIPVRRQTAVKTASKNLSDIKKILQAYAFARPTVRISFKVLKAKNDKYNWIYGPKPGSTSLLDATAKIVGQEVAAQCEARSWTSNGVEEARTALVIDAVLGKGEGDPGKIVNKGQFISIDGRPISTTRGIFKDFTKTYKAYYKHWLPLKQKDFTADPFLCLHLRCPKGSYDVNIEPAKDEVLFSDARQVQKVLEDFLRSAYGALPVETSKKEFRDNRGLASIAEAQSFELLLAKKDGHPNARPENASQRNEGPDLGKGVGANEGKKSGLEVCHTRANNACRPTHEETQSPANDSFATDRRLHRNMYDFDEDDLGAVDPPLGLHGDADAKTDDAELRDVSLTNPWTLAKINAPVSSSTNQSSSVGRGIMNEQFMTPSDLERSGIASTTHMKTFNRITQLPSPLGSDSPYSSTSSPKLGSPLRRSLVPESEEDDIEYTQEPTNASSSYGHNLSSGLVLESMAHKLPSPSSNWSSESIDKGASLENHNALRSRGSGTEKEMSSTQLTDPVEDTMASLPSPSSIRKPFKPPFKTPEKPLALYPPLKLTPPTSPRLEQQLPRRQQTPSNASEGQNTNPPSHGHPPPLSQSHRHPMASPPRLQPSPPSLAKPLRQSTLTPNSDLEEIMDFEYRKKAINSQRKSQNKLTNRYLNPGHLAQLQRESRTSLQAPGPESFSSPFRKLAPPSVDLGDETDDSYNPPRALSRAGPELPPSFQEPANKPPQKQNPHHNRYQAARAALTRPNPRTSPSHAHPLTQNDESALETTISSTEEECLPPLPATDARAYLIQRRKSSHSPGHTLKRTKTSKLPLESIPTDSATYSLSVRPHDAFPSLQDLAIQARELGRVDTYTLSGENEFVKWNAKDLDVPVWEEKIARLVRERYVARLGGEGGEEVPANLQLRLGVVLKAHVEEFT